jgi:hypothetical protein
MLAKLLAQIAQVDQGMRGRVSIVGHVASEPSAAATDRNQPEPD